MADVYGYSEGDARRIKNVVSTVEQETTDNRGPRSKRRLSERRFLAVVDSAGSEPATYNIKSARVTNDGDGDDAAIKIEAFDTDHPHYITGTATNLAEQISKTQSVPSGTPVWIQYDYDQSDPAKVRYWFVTGNVGVIVLPLDQVGGSAGGTGSTCSFTYDIESADGETTLASGVAVDRPRIPNLEMTAANMGYCYCDSDGWHIAEAWEVPATDDCEEEE